MKNRSPIDVRRPRTVLIVTVCLLVASTGLSAGGNGRCATAHVPQAMILPDGSTHAAGTLRVCTDSDYSPVSSLHTLYIDGQPVGMFLSHRSLSEGLSDREQPFFLFYRGEDGSLVFHGHAWPEQGRMHAYRLYDPRPRKAEAHANLTWKRVGQQGGSSPRSDDLVLLGASRY